MPKTKTKRSDEGESVAVMAWHGYRPARTGEQCNGCGPFCGAFVRADRVSLHGGVVCSGCDSE